MVDLAERAREVVGRVLADRRTELEQLVDRELDRQLAKLVVERLAERNGDDATVTAVTPTSPMSDTSDSERLCSRCGRRPRLADRTYCSACKSRAHRQRVARRREHATPAAQPQDGTTAGDEPHPDPAAVAADVERTGREDGVDVAELVARANGGDRSANLTAEALADWLAGSGLATVDERGRLHVTDRARALAGAAFG